MINKFDFDNYKCSEILLISRENVEFFVLLFFEVCGLVCRADKGQGCEYDGQMFDEGTSECRFTSCVQNHTSSLRNGKCLCKQFYAGMNCHQCDTSDVYKCYGMFGLEIVHRQFRKTPLPVVRLQLGFFVLVFIRT